MERVSARQAADLTLSLELLQLKLDLVEAGHRPDASDAWRVGRAFSLKLKRPYTLGRVCRVWGLSRSTVYRKVRASPPAMRPIALADEEIAEQLRAMIRDTPFPAERHRKLWAKLRRNGVQVSRERVRRILDEYSLLPPYLGILVKQSRNEMWGIDSAKVRTATDGEVKVLFAVEHCTFECLAVLVVKNETVAAWSRLLSAAVSHGQPMARVALRLDNLPLFRSPEFREMLTALNLRPSYIAVLRPQSNGIAERFVRLLRENLLGIRSFEQAGEVEHALREFRVRFNREYLVGRFDYRTPLEQRTLLEGAHGCY
jgi:transposase InsO family protein